MRKDLTRAGRPIVHRPQVNNPRHGFAAVRWFTFPVVWDRFSSQDPGVHVVS